MLNIPSISSATRLATDMAATRRGWVHAIALPLIWGRSEYAANCGILSEVSVPVIHIIQMNSLSRLPRPCFADHNHDLVSLKLEQSNKSVR